MHSDPSFGPQFPEMSALSPSFLKDLAESARPERSAAGAESKGLAHLQATARDRRSMIESLVEAVATSHDQVLHFKVEPAHGSKKLYFSRNDMRDPRRYHLGRGWSGRLTQPSIR